MITSKLKADLSNWLCGLHINAAGWTGRFVLYDNEETGLEEKGLILENVGTECEWEIENEIGINLDTKIGTYHSGEFPKASLNLLTEKDLVGKSKTDLKIMKNEIFARYGYIFKPNGEMDKYFRHQSWYRPRLKNVNQNLADFEKRNIELILAAEKQ